MGETKRYENLERAFCAELERLDKKYAGDVEMSQQDAERARILFHALKSAETYYAMLEANEYERGGMSGARYRSPSTGRYVSRDYPEDGYSRHWNPMEYIDPYYDRRR